MKLQVVFLPVAQTVQHGTNNAKGFDSQEKQELIKYLKLGVSCFG